MLLWITIIQGTDLLSNSGLSVVSAALIALSNRLSNQVRHADIRSSVSCFKRGSTWILSFTDELIAISPLENFPHCSLSGITSSSHFISGSPSFHCSYFWNVIQMMSWCLLVINPILLTFERAAPPPRVPPRTRYRSFKAPLSIRATNMPYARYALMYGAPLVWGCCRRRLRYPFRFGCCCCCPFRLE